MKLRYLIFLISQFLVTQVIAGSHSKPLTLYGLGTKSCIDLLKDYEENGPTAQDEQWFLGYISGRIVETQRDLEVINRLEIPIFELVIKSCSENPNLFVYEAIHKVYEMLP